MVLQQHYANFINQELLLYLDSIDEKPDIIQFIKMDITSVVEDVDDLVNQIYNETKQISYIIQYLEKLNYKKIRFVYILVFYVVRYLNKLYNDEKQNMYLDMNDDIDFNTSREINNDKFNVFKEMYITILSAKVFNRTIIRIFTKNATKSYHIDKQIIIQELESNRIVFRRQLVPFLLKNTKVTLDNLLSKFTSRK